MCAIVFKVGHIVDQIHRSPKVPIRFDVPGRELRIVSMENAGNRHDEASADLRRRLNSGCPEGFFSGKIEKQLATLRKIPFGSGHLRYLGMELASDVRGTGGLLKLALSSFAPEEGIFKVVKDSFALLQREREIVDVVIYDVENRENLHGMHREAVAVKRGSRQLVVDVPDASLHTESGVGGRLWRNPLVCQTGKEPAHVSRLIGAPQNTESRPGYQPENR